jgi:opacity protein-like surface antigen
MIHFARVRLVDLGSQMTQRLVESGGRLAIASAVTVGVAIGAASGAQAQGCASGAVFDFDDGHPTSFGPLFSGGSSAAAAIISSIEAANSVFLTQSSAFVSAPPNPKPNQEGGGVWVRGVGGEVDYKGDTAINFNFNTTFGPPTSGSSDCPTKFHQVYGGFQFGQDIAKLNVMGWNLHLGQTAGYIELHGNSVGSSGAGAVPFSTTTQVPYVGTYAVATNGSYFADALVRMNWFETSLNSPMINLNDQKLDAHGVSAAGSLGYRWDVPNSNWFYEPSLGLIWSRTTVDPLNVVAGSLTTTVVNGTLQFNQINSLIGRAGLRVGTTLQSGNVIYQPFAAVSVWHEFDGDIQANYSICMACLGLTGSAGGSITAPNVGTYGQYSLGINGQIVNTGWLGFARVDYRSGDHLEGWSGTGGIRYQYTPGAGPMDMAYAMVGAIDMAYAKVTKAAKAPLFKAAPVVERPVNWTGWYFGGFGGADYGGSKMEFPGVGSAGPQIAGALLGGTLGYNLQSGPWVWGIEGDAGWTNASGSVACAGPVNFPQILFDTDCHDNADWIGTATGRLGYAWGHTLYYGKAGAAWTHESFSVICNQLAGAFPPCTNPAGANLAQISVGDNRTGWTVGFGTEFALTPNWSAKGEINYIDFGNRNLTAQDGTVIKAGIRTTEAKIGVNYRLSP